MTIRPTQPAPELDVATLDGGRFRLAERRPEAFTLVVVYRGLHCPICKGYLRDLERRLDDFAARGVEVIAVSADTRERAAQSQKEWELARLPIGYGLAIDAARRWGLFVSRAVKDTEPAEFAEPGLFLVRPDGTLYAGSIQTMPFARPHFADVLAAADFVIKNNYPPRGDA
jgi:peroxiredoxin